MLGWVLNLGFAAGGSALPTLVLPDWLTCDRPISVPAAGCWLLVRWPGQRSPVPAAVVIGQADGDQTAIAAWGGIAHAANTVYHYAVLPVSGAPRLGPLNPFAVQSRASDGDAVLRGPLPNTPAALLARLAAENRPLVSWSHSSAGQQEAPIEFALFIADDATDFDFGTPAALITYELGRTRYHWIGGALSSGAVRYYTVRARTRGGLLSLIPQSGRSPSGSYGSVSRGRCPKIVAGLTAPVPPVEGLAEVAA